MNLNLNFSTVNNRIATNNLGNNTFARGFLKISVGFFQIHQPALAEELEKAQLASINEDMHFIATQGMIRSFYV